MLILLIISSLLMLSCNQQKTGVIAIPTFNNTNEVFSDNSNISATVNDISSNTEIAQTEIITQEAIGSGIYWQVCAEHPEDFHEIPAKILKCAEEKWDISMYDLSDHYYKYFGYTEDVNPASYCRYFGITADEYELLYDYLDDEFLEKYASVYMKYPKEMFDDEKSFAKHFVLPEHKIMHELPFDISYESLKKAADSTVPRNEKPNNSKFSIFTNWEFIDNSKEIDAAKYKAGLDGNLSNLDSSVVFNMKMEYLDSLKDITKDIDYVLTSQRIMPEDIDNCNHTYMYHTIHYTLIKYIGESNYTDFVLKYGKTEDFNIINFLTEFKIDETLYKEITGKEGYTGKPDYYISPYYEKYLFGDEEMQKSYFTCFDGTLNFNPTLQDKEK